MSFPVYAADFSDGATAGTEVQVQSDFTSDAAGSANVEVQVAEPAEETVEAVGDPVDATTVNEDSIRFYYNDLEKGTIVEYWLKSENPATDKPHTVVPEIDKDKSTPATCIDDEKIWLKATI